MSRIASRFARVEPRRRVRRLVLGLLSDLPRKNCWTIAEWVGESTPDAMHHLLSRAKWDADTVRDDVRGYVVEHLHDERAVLVVDETGDVKKGTGTVGVQRQYTGTARRIENAQVAVYLVYAGRRGHAAVDRELYVPRSWTSDPDRCRAAGLGKETGFATKPELAARMVARFLDAGHPAAWVAGDEVYGGNPGLRTALEERGIGYVLAVACSHDELSVDAEPLQGGGEVAGGSGGPELPAGPSSTAVFWVISRWGLAVFGQRLRRWSSQSRTAPRVRSSSGRTWPPTVMRLLPRSTSSSCIVRIILAVPRGRRPERR